METGKLLSTGKMGPLIARYAIPGAVGLVFFSLQSIVDGMIVGNLVGTDALASVSLIMPIVTLLTATAIIIGVGSQAQMSIGMGQGDYGKTKSALKTGLISITVFAAVFCIFINSFPATVARMMGAEGDLVHYSVSYINGLMPFIVASACFYFFDYSLKALGHPRFAMVVMVGSVLLNAALSLTFLLKFGMGIFGVALATGITGLTGAIISGTIVFRALCRSKTLRRSRGHFSWRLLGRIFYNGSSEGVSEIAMGITLLLFNITLMKYAGKDGVAAFSIINYMIFIGTSIFLGMSDGTIPIVSFNYGAGLWTRIREAVKIVLRSNFIIGCIFLILLVAFSGKVIWLFIGNAAPHVAELASQGAFIMAFAFLMNGFNIFSASFFTAIDDAKISLIIAALRGAIFIIAGMAVLPQLLGVAGIFLTVPIAELLTFTVSATLLRRKLRKHTPQQRILQ